MPTQSARIASSALALMLAAGSAWADQLHVPSQYPTIQAAIDAAVDGDEVVLAAGVYRETIRIPDGFLDITIRGQGRDTTTVSGDLNGDGVGDSVIFYCINGSGVLARLQLQDLTMRDASGPALSYRQASVGGATIHLDRCDIIECGSSGGEGAIYGFNTASMFVSDCRFIRNRGRAAGAITYFGYSLHVVRCEFLGNRSTDSAGAILYRHRNTLIDQELRLDNSIFVGNTGLTSGAIGVVAPLVVEGCTFVDNTSTNATASVIHSFLSPDSFGRLSGGNVVGRNSIVVANNSSTPPYAITAGVAWTGGLGPAPAGATSILLDPLFVLMPSDGGDGWGDDLTTPEVDEGANDHYGNLSLQSGSPAIDRGEASGLQPDAIDLAGNPRLADDSGIPGVSVDIGAYEFQGTSCLSDVNADGVLSPADFSAWISAYNTNRPRADQNRDGDLTPADFSAWVANYNTGC